MDPFWGSGISCLLRQPELYPNPENATVEELEVAMDAAPNKRSYVRLTAIRSLLLGVPRVTLCVQFCRTDRMVRMIGAPLACRSKSRMTITRKNGATCSATRLKAKFRR
jgi:hypothetical protein